MTPFVGVFVLITCANSVLSERHLRFTPNDIKVWSDNDYLNFSYAIDLQNRGANFIFNVLKTIEDVDFTVEGNAVFKGSQRHGGMGGITFNLCRLFTMRNANAMAMFIYARIKSHGKIPEECPIKKGVYKLQKVWIPEEYIPNTFPEVEFNVRLQANAIENQVLIPILNVSVMGEALYKDGHKSGQGRLPLLIGG